MNILFKNVTKKYDQTTVFEGFDYTIKCGKINCLLGASGCGKTTILSMLAGLERFDGEISPKPSAVSYIFQRERLIPSLTVFGNIEYILREQIPNKVEREKRIRKVLELVELSEKMDKYPYELSGGMSQRVAMARAFAYSSEILLMDEPFKALDVALKKRLIQVFLNVWNEDKRTVVFVTHDIDEVVFLGDTIAVLSGKPTKIALSLEMSTSREKREYNTPECEQARSKIYDALMNQ